jgi:hypothetical protein
MTVRLSRWRPVTWRRVLIPATDSPATLDWVISVLFGWGCDRLHVFRAGRRTFTDPVFPLDEAQDEDDAWLSRLFATGVRTLTSYGVSCCQGARGDLPLGVVRQAVSRGVAVWRPVGEGAPVRVVSRRAVETQIRGLVTCMTGCSSGTGRCLLIERHPGMSSPCREGARAAHS